jgi:DNA-binding CsgD family transcriptional regulator
MSQEIVILSVLALALISGPSAFLALWLTYKKTAESSVRTLAFTVLGLSLILLGNATTIVYDSLSKPRDPRVDLLLMLAVFLASVMMAYFLVFFVHESTRKTVTRKLETVFWTFSSAAFFVALSVTLFLAEPGKLSLDQGYLATTTYTTLCQIYTTLVVLKNRKTVVDLYKGYLPALSVILLGVGLFSVSNDIFHFGVLFHGPSIPFSPVFFLLLNGSVLFLCIRELLRNNNETRVLSAESFPDFGFTAREKEIVTLMIDGLSNEEIAETLFISVHTVKNHVTSIFRRVGVTNRFELLKFLPISPS